MLRLEGEQKRLILSWDNKKLGGGRGVETRENEAKSKRGRTVLGQNEDNWSSDKGSKEKHETDKSVEELEWEKRFTVHKIYGRCLLNKCWENFLFIEFFVFI